MKFEKFGLRSKLVDSWHSRVFLSTHDSQRGNWNIMFLHYSNLSNIITPQKGVIKSNGGVTEPLPGVTANLEVTKMSKIENSGIQTSICENLEYMSYIRKKQNKIV